MSMESKLAALQGSKAALKAAIEDRSGLPLTAPLSGYADAIRALDGERPRLQEKTVAPLAVGQTVTADEGFAGLSSVTLTALEGLVPENIPLGITIGGVTGTGVVVTEAGRESFVSPDPAAPVPGSIEDADAHYTAIVGTAPPNNDRLILVDGTGNVTYGYPAAGKTVKAVTYNGYMIPDFSALMEKRAATHPYVNLFRHSSNDKGYLTLRKTPLVMKADGTLVNTVEDTRYWYSRSLASFTSSAWGTEAGGSNKVGTNHLTAFGDELCWSNYDVLREDGSLYFPATEPIYYCEDAFRLTAYDPVTTEFSAVGWQRLAFHADTGIWTYDDFRATPSTGWNYLKNARHYDRGTFSYRDLAVWPETAAAKVEKVDCGIGDLRNWTIHESMASTFTVTYDSATGENTVAYKGTSGVAEKMCFPVMLHQGKTYQLMMDFYADNSYTTGTTAAKEPGRPYVGFARPVVAERENLNPVRSEYSFSKRMLADTKGNAVKEYQTFSCRYTAPADMEALVILMAGTLEDEKANTFHLKNIGLWEITP